MTALSPQTAPRPAHEAAVARRLRPLQVGLALQNLLFWLPVEKMFMTEIGFDAATIAILAAVYAAVVPLLEVPSGVLADRWSRTGVMALATVALAACSLVGGLSTNPLMYGVAAALLGVYFALGSGTADSIVYDTLVEETGSSDGYERWIGRMQMVEAASLVVSAVLGGVLAGLVSARFTYFLTVPLLAAAVVAFWRCDEPTLHRKSERVTYRRQAGATLRALTGNGSVRQVVLLSAIAATTAQMLFEFGPLSLVSMHAPAAVYGPYWAVLVSTVGLGAWLVSRIPFGRRGVVPALGAVLVVAALLPVAVSSLPAIIGAQIVLALGATIFSVRAGFLMHEAVPATLRAGVSSGAGTLSRLTFLPFSLVFGWLSRVHGVSSAGWLFVVLVVGLAALGGVARGKPTGSERTERRVVRPRLSVEPVAQLG
jgi:hypothetical protein